MDPTKILKDISVDLKFVIPPSNKKCMLTIHLKKDKLLLDVVRDFMDDNKIPCYLENSLLSVVEHLIQENLRIDTERDNKIKSESEAIHIRKNLVSKYKKHTVRYNDAPAEDIFPKAYHTLVHSPIPSIFDTLLQLEQGYKQAIKDIVSASESELECIRDRHHREIETQSSCSNGTTSLAERLLEDVEYHQAALASELEEIKRKQKSEYCDLVVKLYEAHQRWLSVHQSAPDLNLRLDGKEIVSEVISSLKKSKNELSRQVLKFDQGYDARSRHGSISSLSEIMLSPVMTAPPSPMFSPVSSSFSGNGDDNYFNDLKMIDDIQEMGFNHDQAKIALEMTNGNKEQAVNLLCEQLDKIDAQIANNNLALPPRRSTMLFTSSPSNGKQKSKPPRRPKLTVLTKSEKKNSWSPMSFFNQKQQMVPTPNTPVKRFSWLSRKVMDDVNGHIPNLNLADNPQMMETFTISLGNQVKSTHNLKLSLSDTDDLLKSSDDAARDMAYKAQTAANLYSQKLTATVLLLTPRDWPKYKLGKSANKAFFARCKESTEFHFKDVESQLEAVEKDFGKSEIQEGDFFITKHSNLPLVHVVFHLVIEFESITSSELTQRSHVIDGLRNILRTIDRFDITSISLPFLLLPSNIDPFTDVLLDENILYKRGELVLKCIKGFMMQNSKNDGEKEEAAKTVSLLLSKNAAEKQFHNFRNLLTRIFKTS
ncbi:protein C12orf4 homolog [Rhizophagus clarus]|nr:protein C12orf4 homolog [Rhizophagus clarus]